MGRGMNQRDDEQAAPEGNSDDAAPKAEGRLPFEEQSDSPYEPLVRAYEPQDTTESSPDEDDPSGGQGELSDDRAEPTSGDETAEPSVETAGPTADAESTTAAPDEAVGDTPEPGASESASSDTPSGPEAHPAATAATREDVSGSDSEDITEPDPSTTPDADADADVEQDAAPAAEEPVPAAEPDGTAIIPAVRVDDAASPEPTDGPVAVPPAAAAPRPSSSPAAYRTPAEQVWAEQQSALAADDEPPVTEHPLGELDGEGAPSRWPRAGMWTVAGLVVLGGLYVGAQWMLADTVPRGTTVAGVDVGGLDTADAAARLDEELGPRAAEPLEVAAGEATTSVDPVAAGLTIDTEATAEDLTSFSWSPSRLWDQLFGGSEADLVVDVDDAALTTALEAAATGIDVAPVDGTVRFSGAKVESTDAVAGTAVVVDEATSVVSEGWLVEETPLELPTDSVEPDVTQDETDAALAEAEVVVSAPVVASVDDQSPELPPEALGDAASFPAKDGALVLTWDAEALDEAIVSRTNDLLTTAEDAHFEFVDGRPKVVGGETGTRLDDEQVVESVGAAAVSTDDRTAEIELVTTDPEDSAESLEELGVEEKIVEFSTPLTDEPVRTQNLVVGASKVNGTLVKPGESFSVTDALAPITEANGYGAAHIISDGEIIDGIGGGLSQMSTNMYNIGFFAGYEDVTHKPHSYYYSRYPEGRESTMFVGSIDMVWTNDTPYGVLIQAWVGDGKVNTVAWSTPYWDVTTSTSDRSNVVEPTTQTVDSPDCVASPAGGDGFSVTVYRKVSHDGSVDKDEAKSWTYKPQNAVECE
ncbi:Vancomycin resistance protein YoaR, contains peptidoglycan-binding and VanW domains [Paraoerskovia marina]|uniref:Vancomycin resistance protein YoaR, contains peptidoglycan-binding and VanW domains n=2 Tax=Paraoerskovia marina TaxID=545619 RepID=A0A1H1UP93_9CELL|nr:Vancomycin resistance protein YoaR, contains peptidoglycan-binding and VanW domains [Paraoerskovia marina]